MEENKSLPDANRLSVIGSTIFLAYSVIPFITFSGWELEIELPGAVFPVTANFGTFVSIIVACLAAAGTDWLLRSHPKIRTKNLIQHLILPTLTALVIGVPLNTIKVGLEWWSVFSFGGILFLLVLVAEYISLDSSDARYALAAVGLTAVSFALYLFLAISLRGAGFRLYIVAPTLGITSGLLCIRTIYLRLGGKLRLAWPIGIAIIVSQLVIGLHYWPFSSLAYGLLLLAPVYALTALAGGIEEERSWRTIWIEPALMMIIIWGMIFLFPF